MNTEVINGLWSLVQRLSSRLRKCFSERIHTILLMPSWLLSAIFQIRKLPTKGLINSSNATHLVKEKKGEHEILFYPWCLNIMQHKAILST